MLPYVQHGTDLMQGKYLRYCTVAQYAMSLMCREYYSVYKMAWFSRVANTVVDGGSMCVQDWLTLDYIEQYIEQDDIYEKKTNIHRIVHVLIHAFILFFT